MTSPVSAQLKRKVLYLKALCLTLWLSSTLLPMLLASRQIVWGPWPLDFWMAAQGSVLVYLLVVTVYAVLVNRWERQAGELSFEPVSNQEP